MKLISISERETMRFGERIGKALEPGDIVCLKGGLGAGKTVFAKGIASGLGIPPDDVASPTFVLVRQYAGRLTLFHIDLYRLSSSAEIAGLGYEEFLYGEGVSVIEWCQRFGPLKPEHYILVEFTVTGPSRRTLTVSAKGKRYRDINTVLRKR